MDSREVRTCRTRRRRAANAAERRDAALQYLHRRHATSSMFIAPSPRRGGNISPQARDALERTSALEMRPAAFVLRAVGAAIRQAWRSRRNRSSPSQHARARRREVRSNVRGTPTWLLSFLGSHAPPESAVRARRPMVVVFPATAVTATRGRENVDARQTRGTGARGGRRPTNVSRGPVGRYRRSRPRSRRRARLRRRRRRRRMRPRRGNHGRGGVSGCVPTLPADEDRTSSPPVAEAARRRRTPPRRRRPRSTAERRASPSTRGALARRQRGRERTRRTPPETTCDIMGLWIAGIRARRTGVARRRARRRRAERHRGPPCEVM